MRNIVLGIKREQSCIFCAADDIFTVFDVNRRSQ